MPVFNVDITKCEICKTQYIIACIVDIYVIQKILAHLDKKTAVTKVAYTLCFNISCRQRMHSAHQFEWNNQQSGKFT